MSITLFGWGPMFGCPSPSPFVMKSDIQLQMLGVEYDYGFADLGSVPKAKAPYVRDGDTLIEDSNFIRQKYETRDGPNFSAGLTRDQMITSWALERMVEGDLRTIMMIERWAKDDNFNKGPVQFFIGVPEAERAAVAKQVRESVLIGVTGSGLDRHSEEDRMMLASMDLAAISMQLADKPFLFGDEPTVADASVAGHIIACATEFFDSPLPGVVRKFSNLVPYSERMAERFLNHGKWPMPTMG